MFVATDSEFYSAHLHARDSCLSPCRSTFCIPGGISWNFFCGTQQGKICSYSEIAMDGFLCFMQNGLAMNPRCTRLRVGWKVIACNLCDICGRLSGVDMPRLPRFNCMLQHSKKTAKDALALYLREHGPDLHPQESMRNYGPRSACSACPTFFICQTHLATCWFPARSQHFSAHPVPTFQQPTKRLDIP